MHGRDHAAMQRTPFGVAHQFRAHGEAHFRRGGVEGDDLDAQHAMEGNMLDELFADALQ